MTTDFIEAKVAEFDELLFVSCPTEEREPFFWRWTVEGKKTLLDFIRRLLLEARREGANGAVDYIKNHKVEVGSMVFDSLHNENGWFISESILDAARTAGEKV